MENVLHCSDVQTYITMSITSITCIFVDTTKYVWEIAWRVCTVVFTLRPDEWIAVKRQGPVVCCCDVCGCSVVVAVATHVDRPPSVRRCPAVRAVDALLWAVRPYRTQVHLSNNLSYCIKLMNITKKRKLLKYMYMYITLKAKCELQKLTYTTIGRWRDSKNK